MGFVVPAQGLPGDVVSLIRIVLAVQAHFRHAESTIVAELKQFIDFGFLAGYVRN